MKFSGYVHWYMHSKKDKRGVPHSWCQLDGPHFAIKTSYLTKYRKEKNHIGLGRVRLGEEVHHLQQNALSNEREIYKSLAYVQQTNFVSNVNLKDW